MFIEDVRASYNDGILNAMDKLLISAEFSFECLSNINYDKQMEVLRTARDIYNHRDSVRICSICRHSELIREDWMSSSLCLDCGRIRNNKSKVSSLLGGLAGR